MGLIEDLLSGGSPQPEQLSGPAPDPSGSDWTQAIAGGLAGGISGYNRAPLLAILGMQEQEQRKRMVDLQNKQEGYKQVAQLADLLRQPIANRKLLTASAIKNGVLPKEYGDLISKATDEQAQGLADTLSQWARETPDFNADMLRGILQHMPSHEMGLTLFQLDQQRRQEAQSKIANEIQAGGGGGTPTPDQLSGPQAQPQDEGAALAQGISALGAQLQAVGNQRQAILTRVTNPAAQKAALANLNVAEDNIRGRIGQLQSRQSALRQEKQDIVREQRYQQDKQLQQQHWDQMARQWAQGFARQNDNQDRIDARQERYLEAFMRKPLDPGDREAVSLMEENFNIAKKLKAEFTPDELKQYVGLVNAPMQRLAQVFRDPNSPEAQKFARFTTLTNEAKGFAFGEGGKQLTNTEKAITWGHLPTGTEFNIANYVSNLDRTIERTESLVNRRIGLATTPRSGVTSRVTGGGGSSSASDRIEIISPAGVSGTIPASQLEDALKKGYRRK